MNPFKYIKPSLMTNRCAKVKKTFMTRQGQSVYLQHILLNYYLIILLLTYSLTYIICINIELWSRFRDRELLPGT